jgi:arginase family enzyme
MARSEHHDGHEASHWPEPVDSMVYPRHSGICTFLRLPHVRDASTLDLAFVGVPFDTSAGYRVGATMGSRDARDHLKGSPQSVLLRADRMIGQ